MYKKVILVTEKRRCNVRKTSMGVILKRWNDGGIMYKKILVNKNGGVMYEKPPWSDFKEVKWSCNVQKTSVTEV